MTFPRSLAFGLAGAVLASAALRTAGQLPTAAEHETIAYSATAPDDAVARLQKRIDAGEVTLAHDANRGYLPAVLRALDIPVESQTLVFSRTSFQVDRIAPWSPRALYFNDDVYVGWVQNGPVMELAAMDAKLGAVFYTLAQDARERPAFRRETSTCLLCHDSSSTTGGVPGLVVRSILPDRYGYTITAPKGGVTTDQTPIEDRWGGWYVTGRMPGQRHFGNLMAPMLAHEVGNVKNYLATLDLTAGANVTSLDGRFDAEPYLSPHSDVVALLLLTHQSFVHNVMTGANYETRRAMYDDEGLRRSTGRQTDGLLEATTMRVNGAADRLLRAMLFSREAPLAGRVSGTTPFAARFSARGPFDRRGRSLRQLDLETRLFRYPLSYLIYSEQFDRLPAELKTAFYRRLGEVLTGRDQSKDFAHLSADDRQAILEILRDTKPEAALGAGL
ncbi:MAG: hypothetical protein AB1635_19480 [Acidobacteriota bacterium]